MIEDLKPYPEYKDSGLPWLGEVPAHWEIARSKRLFRQRKEFANPEDQQLSATQAYGVISQALYEKRTGYRVVKISMHLDKRKHVEAGDFVISMRSFQGGLERAWKAGAIRSSYVVLKPSAEVSAGYFQHLFKSHQYINALRATSDFIRDGQDLNFGNFCGVALPLIPLQEQAAIARFLAWATNRLDRAIGAKRRIIALLQEQRQAIIHRAVTRGLDPSVPLKDSGIPWLEEIPEHWEVWRISRFAAVGNGSTPSRAEPRFWTGGHYPWLNSSQINRGHIDSSDQFVTSVALRECHLPKVTAGSILVAITGQGKTRGMSAVLETEATISQHLAFISPCRAIASPEFLRFALTAAYPQLRAISDDSGSTKGALTCEDLKRFYLPIPPAEEQTMLINRTQALTGDLLHSISRLECEITLLREYRTRLIADVVTGKLDVREVAKGLQEEELQDQPDVAAGYDADEAEDDSDSDPIDTEED
jgi:type I restriction enzyme S subunit